MFIIDRFEGEWVVIECDSTTFNIPRFLLPSDAKESDVVSISFFVDQTTTKERQQKGEAMMKGFSDSYCLDKI